MLIPMIVEREACRMGTRWRRGMLALGLIAFGAGSVRSEAGRDPKAAADLGMTPAVACRSIQGYDKFIPLPEAALTKDDKLLVYYKPYNFKIERVDERYRAHLVQDARIRRRDRKAVLWSKDKILEYEAKDAEPPTAIYLANTIAIKDLTPGEYDLDIVLHDLVGNGTTATQTLRFRVEKDRSGPPPSEKDDQAAGAPGEP